jgi:hypothetical protein
MASSNRTNQINRILKVVKKHFKPVKPPAQRTVLEHLLFSCCLENSPPEEAEAAFRVLSEEFFDWNEVRVSSVRELAEAMKMLVDSEEAAIRLKRSLQSVFESVYAFDLEPLTKENLGKATERLARYPGTTPFVVAYVTQAALGGHAIPVNRGLLCAFHVLGVINDQERDQWTVPGLERAIPKSKGQEVGSILHQFGVQVGRSPHSPAVRKLLLEIDPDCKDRLPKRPKAEPPSEQENQTAPPRKTKKKTADRAAAADAAEKKKPPKKSAKAKTSDRQKAETGGPRKKKTQPATGKQRVKKTKTASRRLAKSKPR